jgi:hypothetical protein
MKAPLGLFLIGSILVVSAPLDAKAKTAKALLESSEALLREQRYADAAAQLRDAFEQMRKTKLTEPAGSLLARSFLLSALAAAGEGRAEDAGFDWTTAVAFDPKVAEIGIAPYGPAADKLLEAAAATYRVQGQAVPKGAEGVTPPKLVREPKPDFPNHWTDCRRTQVQIDGWVDESGRVRGVSRVQSNCGSGLILTALKSLRSRDYEPARRGDVAVAATLEVQYVLTVDVGPSTPIN